MRVSRPTGFNLLCNAEISDCNADARIKADYFKVNKAEHHIHLQHFQWFQGNGFQSSFGSYIKDTTQSLKVYLKVAVPSSKPEQRCSVPCSFTKKCYHEQSSTMLRTVTCSSSDTRAHTYGAQPGGTVHGGRAWQGLV